MTFIKGLVTSGYTFQPECGVWVKQDSEGILHSYLQDPEDNGDLNTWNYEKCGNLGKGYDELIESKQFTV